MMRSESVRGNASERNVVGKGGIGGIPPIPLIPRLSATFYSEAFEFPRTLSERI